jgi:uncharacterized protein DUF5681
VVDYVTRVAYDSRTIQNCAWTRPEHRAGFFVARGRKPRPRAMRFCVGTRKTPNQEREKKIMLFQKGQSGNPAGRPRGSRNRSKVLFQDRLDADVEEIADKVVALAKAGDIAAIRLCVDRLMPVRKGEPVEFELPPFETAADIVRAAAGIAAAVSAGELTPSEAADLTKVLDMYVRALETAGFEERLMRLERAQQAADEPTMVPHNAKTPIRESVS